MINPFNFSLTTYNLMTKDDIEASSIDKDGNDSIKNKKLINTIEKKNNNDKNEISSDNNSFINILSDLIK